VQVFKVGEVIDGRYEITDMLGYGGMAHVFRSFDRHLERDVALKILRPHLTEADQERFRREIKTLAQLSHPGIVSIYDLGRGDAVYFTMELITGGLFTELGPYDGDPEPSIRFLDAAIVAAETLAYVHRHGMVHRDLTPRNILLTEQGHPKVMDFGLVQLAEASRQLTRTGLTLGTPQYMAPEQAKGDPTGAHTDLYAFGAVLYRTVTGFAPFDAENDQAVLYQHVYGTIVPPHERNPAVDEDLAALISALLSKDPLDRPGSGDAIADALRTLRTRVARRATQRRAGGAGGQGVVPCGPTMPRALKRAWQIKLSDGPQWPSAMTAAEGFILVGLRSEEICVVRPADGGIHARFRAGDEVNSPVAYENGTLYFASRDGELHAMGWPTGQRRWSDPDAGAIGLLTYGSTVLVTTNSGLEARDGDNHVLWTYAAESTPVVAPIQHRRNAIFATRSGWIHVVNARSGDGRYKFELGPIVASPAAKDGILLLPERNGELHAFDMEQREVLWSYDTEGQLWAAPVIWERFVFIASWSGCIRCLSLRSGHDVWSFDTGGRVTAAPTLAGGMLYVVTEESDLIALEARSGQLLYRDRAGTAAIQASPLVLDDSVIVAALDGTIRAYG
jgi:eukaryotic-like serine/threonine-protein kinase